jgi:2,3-bisphosphoglycerate-independent phosphoglycerate mutase
MLVGDGMGDLPMAELEGKTPLEYVDTPAMDFVASNGELSLLRTVPEGFPPGSDVANLSLLGYKPEDVYSGRSPLEAASMGVELAPDEVAFRCNLVTLDEGDNGEMKMVDYSGGHISTPEAQQLINSLQNELGSEIIRFYPGVSYRHLLVVKKGPEQLATEPPHDHTGKSVTPFWNTLLQSGLGDIVARARLILTDHEVNRQRIEAGQKPANSIWLWGQGKAPAMPTISEKFGVSGSLISAVDLLKGIGTYAGLKIINVEGATGYIDTNYQGKVDAALKAIVDDDFVLVHVEAPDEAGHQGRREDKLKAIADFDSKVVKPILAAMKNGPPFRLVVAMDHFTPLSTRTHDGMPVPVAVYDSQYGGGSGLNYTENNAIETGVFYTNGEEFFQMLVQP